jgi:MBG domain
MPMRNQQQIFRVVSELMKQTMGNKSTKLLPIFLAASLQMMPLLRNIVGLESQALAPSGYAFILKIGVCAVALLGFDAVSSASSVTISPATATNGVPYSGIITYNGAHAYQVQSMTLETMAGTNCMDSSVPSVPFCPGLTAIYSGPSNAIVTGTPTTWGTIPFTILAQKSLCGGNTQHDTRSSTLTIQGVPAAITLGNLNQTYDGTAKSVTVSTTPPGLAVNVTYNGFTNLPTGYGFYHVNATIVDATYQGSTNATLVIGGWPVGQPYLEEGFNYPPSQLGSNDPWISTINSSANCVGGNLTYPGLTDLSPSGGALQVNETAATSYTYRPFIFPATNGIIYCSLLLDCSAVPVNGSWYIAGMLSSSNTVPGGRTTDPIVLVANAATGGYKLAVGTRGDSGTSSTYAANVLALNTTNLVVLKFDLNAATASLFVNPLPGAPEPATPDASDVGLGMFSDLSYVYIRSTASSGNWTYDTIRIAPTWAAVTVGSTPPPVISLQQSSQTGNLQLSWAISAGAFQVQTAVNPSGPWNTSSLPVITNGANATVTVTATNQQQYFRLQGN